MRTQVSQWVVRPLKALLLTACLMVPAALVQPVLAGFDLDGNADLVFASYLQPHLLCLGDGAGSFSCNSVPTSFNQRGNKVAVGDLNNDGNVDAVFAVEWQSIFSVCLGDGGGGLTCNDISTGSNHFLGVTLGDVNHDGDLDALFANYANRDQVCLGDGAGGFICSDVSTDSLQTYSVALGDLNADGDLDAVFANRVGNDRVCLGDGTGNFACGDVRVDPVELYSFDVALGHVNGDGNLDAVFSDCSGHLGYKPDRVCLGDGSGGFECSDFGASTGCSYGTALGDFDSDGNLDAVFSNQSGRNPFCLGDGAGSFICSDVSVDTDIDNDVAAGDLDGDGNLDAVFVSYAGKKACLGDGTGGFNCSAFGSATNSRGVAIASRKIPDIACVGFDPPLDNGPVSVKKNRALPFKALLNNSDGQPVDDLGIAASPVIQVLFEDGVSPAVDVTGDAFPTGAGTDGNQFEFLDSKWHFNLKTGNYTAAGTYTVTMESGDTSEYLVDPTCTAQFVIR